MFRKDYRQILLLILTGLINRIIGNQLIFISLMISGGIEVN